jgi:DNA-binding response OmpR family regulator
MKDDRLSKQFAGQIGKVLVVDDEETMRRSLADILRLEGFQVQAVSTGESAVDALRKDNFDVMLLDLKMPGMDGLEVLRTASRIAPETMVILLTAHGSLESAIEAIRFQAHDYLVKPATTQQILNSVTKAMGRRMELLHKRSLMEQRGASLGDRKEGLEGQYRPGTPVEFEPRLIPLANGVLVDLARREMWGGSESSRQGSAGDAAGDRTREGRALQPFTGKVKLTPTEAKLLKVLLENRGRVLTHRELVLMVQGYEVTDWEAPEVLRPLVSRLRQKLNHFQGGESWIVNVRGTGYVLERRQLDHGPTDGVERRLRKGVGG